MRGGSGSDYQAERTPARGDARDRFRASVRRHCEEHIAPHGAQTDRDGPFPDSGYLALRDRGWHAAAPLP